MKYAIISVLAATALTLGACSHMTRTAAREVVPVASLTVEEVRAELAAISRQLDSSPERLREKERNLRRTTFLGRALRDTGVSSYALRPVSQVEALPHAGQVRALLNRRDELLAQLARTSPQS